LNRYIDIIDNFRTNQKIISLLVTIRRLWIRK